MDPLTSQAHGQPYAHPDARCPLAAATQAEQILAPSGSVATGVPHAAVGRLRHSVSRAVPAISCQRPPFPRPASRGESTHATCLANRTGGLGSGGGS